MATRQCRFCASEIPSQAVLCPICKSYQAAWRNNLLFAAGLTGFITLIASGFAYFIHQSTETYKQMFWRDTLNVLELRTGPPKQLRAVLSNAGDGPVFVTQVDVYWRNGSYKYPIYKTVPVNSIDIVDSTVPNSNYDTWIVNSSGALSEDVLRNSGMASLLPGEEPKCFFGSIIDSDNVDLARMKDHYGGMKLKLVVDKAEANIQFFSSRTGARIKKSIPVVVGFIRLATPECRGIAWD